MKNLLLLFLILFSLNANGQAFPQIQIFSPQQDSQVVNGKVWDATGNMTIAPYVGVWNSNGLNPDGYWIIQPDNDTSTRWVLLTRPMNLSVSTTTYTVTNGDFAKTLNLSNTAARTITMCDVATVNTDRLISFKDVAGTAGTAPITINYSGGIDGGTSVQINCNYCELSLYKKGTIYSVK